MSYVLYHDQQSRSLKIDEVPRGKTGQQVVAGILGRIHISNHPTKADAEAALALEADPPGGVL